MERTVMKAILVWNVPDYFGPKRETMLMDSHTENCIADALKLAKAKGLKVSVYKLYGEAIPSSIEWKGAV
jgi:hypothetical protein